MFNRLQDFLEAHAIDIDALARVKHRLFVVGRFNRRKVSPEVPPNVYLFTNRPKSELSEQYLDLFTQKLGLSYEDFIKALQPAIAEQVRHGRIPAVIQYMPAQDGAEDGSVVIDMWNFFFWRAIANSDQKAFTGDLSSAAREILREGERDPGKGIYKLIRKNLNLLCSFQPRTPQLIEAFSALLASSAMLHGLPAYASGGALPRGFLEKLIDFVYLPDLTTDFSLDGIDLTEAVWDGLRKSEKAQKSLIRVANTFRNALVGAADQHADMRVIGGTTVFKTASDLLAKKKDLVQEFRQAREAYNALSQVVRSRVLLSMVLEWVFKAHYDLDPVKAISDEDDQDQMVERLVLGKVPHAGVAVPVKRATTEEREKFKKSLADNFEKLILAAIAEEDTVGDAVSKLPPEVRSVAEQLRGDPERSQILRRMAIGSGDPRPFIESQKTVLLDVLIPVLYQAPTMDLFDLRMLFRREVQTAYLTAVTLDDKYQGIVRQLAQEFLPTFLGNIDKDSRTINRSEAMQGDLLRVYVERIASKDMAERIIEAQEAIRRAMTVLENTTIRPGETRGASHLSPIYDENVGAARKTQPNQRIAEALGNLAVETAKESLDASAAEKVTESVSSGEPAKATLAQVVGTAVPERRSVGEQGHEPPTQDEATQETRQQAVAEAAAAPAATAETSQETAPTDSIRDDVKAMVSAFIASNPAQQREDLIAAIRVKARDDKKIVSQAEDAVRIFHQILNVVYQRYRENQGKASFVGRVERMTLSNLMLANQENLNLGKSCSNLYPMLLDAVENMDPENPDPRSFIRDFSLTRYFDNDVLEKENHQKSGITELRTTLAAQAHESLQNTVSFISELRGIKYLMDAVGKDSRAEVVVVNATADEFLDWIERDNLTGPLDSSRQRLQSGFVRDAQQSTACPGLVYLTDSAFAGGGKGAWLESLKKPLVNGTRRLVLPPLCLSTGVQDDQDSWISEGLALAKVAEPKGPAEEAVPAPVVIVGPSPYLNRPGDVFGTYLPAGYLFAAHFLCKPDQRVTNKVGATDNGRFRVIGGGIGTMKDTLERVLWGGDADDTYAFAVDFYLYTLLSVLATAQNNRRTTQPKAKDFFPFFTGHKVGGMRKDAWMTSTALDKALLGEATKFALEQDVSEERLMSAWLLREFELHIRDVQWFNQALEKADLPRYPSESNRGVLNQ